MLNIFNLFLFLFVLWILLMFSFVKISWSCTILGIFSAAIISFFSYKIGFINKKSDFLYLDSSFYHRFFKNYFKGFFSSIMLIINMAFNIKKLKPTIRIISLTEEDRFNHSLLLASFNMSMGIFCFRNIDEKFFIHFMDDEYFEKFNIEKTIKLLNKIKEDDSI